MALGGGLVASAEQQAQLQAIARQCRISSAYYLRLNANKAVTIHVRPEVRAVPLKYDRVECVRAGLAKLGLRLADPRPAAKPATTADLQSILARIHYYCDLGPYELKAKSRSQAFITIPPTMRVKPLSRRKHRCVKEQVEQIRGVKLERGIVPTVD